MSACQHEFVYARPLWGSGYNIACRKCGDVHGFSRDSDPRYLAGFNRPGRPGRPAGPSQPRPRRLRPGIRPR